MVYVRSALALRRHYLLMLRAMGQDPDIRANPAMLAVMRQVVDALPSRRSGISQCRAEVIAQALARPACKIAADRRHERDLQKKYEMALPLIDAYLARPHAKGDGVTHFVDSVLVGQLHISSAVAWRYLKERREAEKK
jgi:hypothetical protein